MNTSIINRKESSDFIEQFKRYENIDHVKFGFTMSKTEFVNIFHVTQHDRNYWPQSSFIPLLTTLYNPLEMRVYFFIYKLVSGALILI